jgi:hypothetical protein
MTTLVRGTGKDGIRPYGREHTRQVIRLYRRMFLEDRPVEPTRRAALDDFFSRSIFEDPWRHDDLPSFVYQTSDGDVTAFLGVLPRDMSFDGAPIRVAVASAFMVDPSSRPAGIALMRTLMNGPQDLTMTDGATEQTRRILERLGYRSFPSMSMNWFRVFRPSQLLLSRYTRSGTPARRAIARIGRPVCSLVDRPLAGLRELGMAVEDPGKTRSRPLDDAELLDLIDEVSRTRRLRPRYDAGSLGLVLDSWRQATHRGTFTQALVEGPAGEPLGWYLGHVQLDGTSEIIQIGAHDGSDEIVFGRMLVDCERRGSALAQGRSETRLLRPAIANGCFFRPAAWTLVHSRNEAIVDAFEAEDVFLSGLENERPW